MFESTNFIDEEKCHTPQYHKVSLTSFLSVQVDLKLLKLVNSANSDSTGDECNKVFNNNALKWCWDIKRFCKLKKF